jgi:hypothetical protein
MRQTHHSIHVAACRASLADSSSYARSFFYGLVSRLEVAWIGRPAGGVYRKSPTVCDLTTKAGFPVRNTASFELAVTATGKRLT